MMCKDSTMAKRPVDGRRVLLGLVVLGLLTVASGCTRGSTSKRPPIHPNPNMDQQPKYRAQASSEFFFDGGTMRHPVEGTVARGELFEDVLLHTGRDEAGNYATAIPFAVDGAVLARGEQRYGIYCVPCHSDIGDGRGALYQKAQVQSADLREERIRNQPDGQIFDTITNGLGLMSGYKYPIPPHDRWAIIAYVRELQQASGS